MTENQSALLGLFILLAILAVPVGIGAYIAIKHGPAIQRRAEVRRMETAILKGQVDADYTQEAVENLQKKGLL